MPETGVMANRWRDRALLALVAALLVAGCSSATPGDPAPGDATPAEPTALQVTSTTATFEDESRPTVDSENDQLQSSRTLETTIWYPADGDGPYPLVLFSHGYLASPEAYEELLSRWASAGMVVAAPRFPLSAEGTEEIRADVVQQPEDVSFVLDGVLELGRTQGSDIEGLVDEERLAAAGHSLGALTTALLRSEAYYDDRFDAALVLAGGELTYLVPELGEQPTGPFVESGTPVLFVHGGNDDAIPLEQGEQLYGRAPEPKAFVEVPDADHSRAYDDDSSPTWPVIAEATTDYLEWALDIDPEGLERLRSTVEDSGTAELVDERLG
ncbi:alpha/beta hydrolase family protein [Geodermatophilus amargosae]|uniref:alpha/beta hydrolase family protein n=1 Tax=Geodermatophilus amargosae TaxID=1296565 RepID=UPI0034DF0D3D